ncbi:hypothetical protein EYZ11_008519 [Aspergillus tanneri]|uniref:Uncharacterized protein n=1 Tax=Aspergillus tanneri TaxID=1220188 RepID=A0A4S3JAH1_9EURO|nr:hypothetical protein EYZ11_008519 [Aspergillus tanneri]
MGLTKILKAINVPVVIVAFLGPIDNVAKKSIQNQLPIACLDAGRQIRGLSMFTGEGVEDDDTVYDGSVTILVSFGTDLIVTRYIIASVAQLLENVGIMRS